MKNSLFVSKFIMWMRQSSLLLINGDMGVYHTYQEMVDEINLVHATYPNITTISSIGQSVEGREIWAVKVSDNPGQEETDEPDVLYVGNIHAREVATPEVILYFLNYLVSNYGTDNEATFLVNNRELWLIPTLNPDGHVYVETVDPWWRKNRRDNGDGSHGVDLNRNFGYQWGYDNSGSSPTPSSNTYRGTAPFSEPETEALRQLCISHRFVVSLMYHSYGRMWLLPWGYIPQNTPHHEVFMHIARNCVAYNGYIPGNYANGVIYGTNGDSDDYFYGEQAEKNMIFGFSPEIGTAFWPPESDLPQILQENLGPNLYVASIASLIEDNPDRIYPPAVPTMNELGNDDDGNYTVSWTIQDDPINPAVAYYLNELSGDTLLTETGDGGDTLWDLQGFEFSHLQAHTSQSSLYSQMGDNLNNHATMAFPLVVKNGMTLAFWARYNIENDWDYAYVEVSTDGGENFQSISGNITTNDNPNGANLGNGITGNSGGWVEAVFDLSNYVGQSIVVRFHYITDEYISEEGIFFDDIYPVPYFSSDDTLSDNISDTSFPISGKTPGTYFYRVRARDRDDQWGGWSQLEDIVVTDSPSDCQLGDVNMDGDITSGDAFCAFYRYFTGSFPTDSSCSNPCAEFAADINCSRNRITPGDALYIFRAYLNGETPPLDCLPGSVLSANFQERKQKVWFEKLPSSNSEILTIAVYVDASPQVTVFGMDVGFPVHLLKFAGAQSGQITETWEAFDAAEPLSGVIRLGGFAGDESVFHGKRMLAKLQFQLLEGARGKGEIYAMNFADDLLNAESIPLHFELAHTDVKANEKTQQPLTYVLEQNSPNPFKSDLGSDLSSGVYILKMKASQFCASQKILLMK
ncbi:hypothetical protein B6D60_10330 [candidate division KSB1 bacterium 4484_87]|nr:MAG: hypothetical protein B6D60_10330 [candidate division KSB1 bacterium 4484_87]